MFTKGFGRLSKGKARAPALNLKALATEMVGKNTAIHFPRDNKSSADAISVA